MFNDLDESATGAIAREVRKRFYIPVTGDSFTLSPAGGGKVKLIPRASAVPSLGTFEATASTNRINLPELSKQWGVPRIPTALYATFEDFSEAFMANNAISLIPSDVSGLAFPLDLRRMHTGDTIPFVAGENSYRLTGSTVIRVYEPPTQVTRLIIRVPDLGAKNPVPIGVLGTGSSAKVDSFDVILGGESIEYTITKSGDGKDKVLKIIPDKKIKAGDYELEVRGTRCFYTALIYISGDERQSQIYKIYGTHPTVKVLEFTTPIRAVGQTSGTFRNETRYHNTVKVTFDVNCFSKNINNGVYVNNLFTDPSITELPTGIFDNVLFDGTRYLLRDTNIVKIPSGLFRKSTVRGSWKAVFPKSVTTVESGVFPDKTDITSFTYVFYQCSRLTSLPDDIFRHAAGNVTDGSYFAYGCTKLTTLPANIFEGCSKLTKLEYSFSGTGVTSIPADILYPCTELDSVNGLFSYCGSLLSIPEDMFSKSVKITKMNSTFSGTTVLNDFPMNIFRYTPELTNISSVFSTSGIRRTGTSKWEFTPYILGNCLKITQAYSSFANCPFSTLEPRSLDMLTETTTTASMFGSKYGNNIPGSNITEIPEDLLSKCSKLTSITSMFAKTKITEIPKNLLNNLPLASEIKDCTDVFNGSEYLTTVPVELFSKLTGVTYISGMFEACTALKSVPTKLLEPIKSTLLGANNVFRRSGMVKLEAGLFGNCTSLSTISQGFEECSWLLSVEASPFVNCTKLSQMYALFNGCNALTSVGDGPISPCPDLENVGSLFGGCTRLTTVYISWFSLTKTIDEGSYLCGRTGIRIVPAGFMVGKTKLNNLNSIFYQCGSISLVEKGWIDIPASGVTLDNAFEKAISAVPRVYQDDCILLNANCSIDEMFLNFTSTPRVESVTVYEKAISCPKPGPKSHYDVFTRSYYQVTKVCDLTGNAKPLVTALGLKQSDMESLFTDNNNLTYS